MFIEKLINHWLEVFSNDLKSKYYLAKIAFLNDKQVETAKLLTEILLRDPEFLDAYDLLAQNHELKDRKAIASFIHVISGKTEDISLIFPWAITLRAARNGIRKGELNNSEILLRKLLAQEDTNPLVAIEHCRLSSMKDENSLFTHLVDIYQSRWPDCIHFKLFKAQYCVRVNEDVNAINLLHDCLASDPEGQVISRVFGKDHEFYSLWQSDHSIDIDFQIPASIAVSLKWNQLKSGGFSTNDKNAEIDSQHFKEEGSEAIKIGSSHRKNRVTPVYVILSSYNGLSRKYGEKTAEFLIDKLSDVAAVIGKKPNWESLLFIPDDVTYVQKFGILPINKIDAWQIKLSLHDLDKYLKKQSKMIGAVLVVGGHEIIPFHNLPNPTDDSDKAVLSDNPYCTTSGNFLVQEWPVGRLPDEKGSDPGLILEQLRQIIQFHESSNLTKDKLGRIISDIKRTIDLRRLFTELFKTPKDFGYSAAVWRRSSLATFRPIGKGAGLRITPPYDSDTIDIDQLMKAKCAYFNLHGLSDTTDWYGQRDFSEEPTGPDFPVAISARQIQKIRNNVDLVYSEACYGGFVNGKRIDDSMALKLISAGSQGLVASTCIAYGSVFTPLIGADLLGFIFWKYIKDGFSFGESLLQAKLGLIKVMTQRQGYLDGEDQKTLLSFVLYGDPLGYLEPNIYLEKQPAAHELNGRTIKVVNDQDGILTKNPRISKSLSLELNEIMQSYIPSLNNADVKIREHQIRINKLINSSKDIPGHQKTSVSFQKYTQLQYSQKTRGLREVHEQFVRVTLDEYEKVIKLAVSR